MIQRFSSQRDNKSSEKKMRLDLTPEQKKALKMHLNIVRIQRLQKQKNNQNYMAKKRLETRMNEMISRIKMFESQNPGKMD